MKKLFPFLALLVFPMFGNAQSGIYNVSYKPQPRILIPHVEAPAVLVDTNGTVSANPYRSLKYCDFVLKAVDQSGTIATGDNPVVWVYASAGIDATNNICNIFYQKTDASWPQYVQRKEHTLNGEVEFDWISSDTPPSLSNFPPYIDVLSHTDPAFTGRLEFVTADGAFGGVDYGHRPWTLPFFEFLPNGTWLCKTTYGAGYHIITGFINARVSCPDIRGVQRIYTPGGICISSESSAVAIEVYPHRTALANRWMKQGNPDIKWMCSLSNGIDFYRDAASNVVWFTPVVEWVEKIPNEGVWE